MESIKIYDDLLDFSWRFRAFDILSNSFFRLGWTDSVDYNHHDKRYFFSSYSTEEIKSLGILDQLKNTEIEATLFNKPINKCIVNLSVPTDSFLPHVHHNEVVLLYYANLEWLDNWHGETLFYSRDLKEIVFTSLYRPGRMVVFDGSIPHSLRPQSIKANHHRFTLSMFFSKS